MTRSRSTQHRKVEEARRVVSEALGDRARLDGSTGAAMYVPIVRPDPEPPKSEAIPVLLVSEAATELGISTDELERMVAAGKVKTLTAGWTVVVPASEVKRLASE